MSSLRDRERGPTFPTADSPEGQLAKNAEHGRVKVCTEKHQFELGEALGLR
jgi:hypothetical protein